MRTYAIIETGGQQLRVEPGRFYNICHLSPIIPNEYKQYAKISIHRVLMIRQKSRVSIGHPWLEGAVVRGRILHAHLDKKITIYRMIPKKKMRRESGHRQKSTRFLVDSISWNGEEL